MKHSLVSFTRFALVTAVVLLGNSARAEDKEKSKPVELELIKASIGVWDAACEVWPQGRDKESVKFKGVETNRAFGEYWLASDFESEFMGQVSKVHSIVGYDLNQGKLVGKIIDHAPYMATMTGDYDQKAKTITWTTKVKTSSGKPMEQKTTVTLKSADKRLLVLSMLNQNTKKFSEFMRITYTRRK